MELAALGHGLNCQILSHIMTTPENDKTQLILMVVNATIFNKNTKNKRLRNQNTWEIDKQCTNANV